MTLLIAPLVFIGVIIYVALPFLADADEAARQERKLTALESALKRKEDIIGNLKDIEMDFRMGKLSEEDYQALKSEYEGRAIAVFHEMDSLDDSEDLSPSRKKK
jgi:hypothetical protein